MSELWTFFFCGAFGISFVGLMLLRRHAPWIKHTHKMDIAGHNGRSTTRSTTRDERAARSARL
jgi:hypothetical protein